MITYRFVSQTFLGQPIKVQYSKYSSSTRIDLGSGTFPFEYTTDQKGGTYYFYIPSVDRTFTKTIDIPPFDFVVNFINVTDCDISGMVNEIPACDITSGIIEIPVCDIDYNLVIVSPTPTPTTSVVCPIITGVTVGPIEISGGQPYTLVDNISSFYLYQFNSAGQYICDIPPQSNSILPDSLFQDEITVLVPSPYWFDGPCQYCFNINTGEQFECNQVIPTQLPTPSTTQTPTITPTPEISVSPTPTITPTPEISVSPTPTITPTPSITPTITSTVTPTPSITSTLTQTPSITPSITPTINIGNIVPLGDIKSFDITVNVISETNSNRFYLMTSAGTEVFDSGYNSIGYLSISAISSSPVSTSLFDSKNKKLYFSSYDVYDQKIQSFDLDGKKVTDISTPNTTFAMCLDKENNLIGSINGLSYGIGELTIIDSTSDTINYVISGVSCYKGDVATDNNGIMFTVGNDVDLVSVVDVLTQTITSNITIQSTGSFRKLIYNSTNNYLYVLNIGDSIEIIDVSKGSSIDIVDITGYSGLTTNGSMTYNPNQNYIYILNVKSNGSYGIIAVNCTTNQIIYFKDNILTGNTIQSSCQIYYDIVTTNELLIVGQNGGGVVRLSVLQ